jgi:hypothetical protein
MYIVDWELLKKIPRVKLNAIGTVVSFVAVGIICNTGGLNRHWTKDLPLLLYPSVAIQIILLFFNLRGKIINLSYKVILIILLLQLFFIMFAMMESGYKFYAS